MTVWRSNASMSRKFTMSRPRRLRGARNASRPATSGCICGSVSNAVTSAAATILPTVTPPSTFTKPSTPLCAASSRARTGAGVMSISSGSSRRRNPRARLPPSRLNERHDVPLRVLEPGSLVAVSGDDAVLRFEPWHVVLLEPHAASFQLGDFSLQIGNLPERLACFGRPSVGRRIEKARGALLALVRHAARNFARGSEAERPFVKLAGACHVLRRDVCEDWAFLQHGSSLDVLGHVLRKPLTGDLGDIVMLDIRQRVQAPHPDFGNSAA